MEFLLLGELQINMAHYVMGDPTRGTFTDIDLNPLTETAPGVYILPPNDKCLGTPYAGFAFSEWIGAYVRNQTGGMLDVITWWGEYVEGLFTPMQDYKWDIQNGSYPYQVDPLTGSYPPGMTPTDDGTSASGNLIQGGTYPITVQVTASDGATATVSCDIEVPLVVLDCNNPPDGFWGEEYSHQLLASGGTPPYSFDFRGGELPPGLRIDPLTGIITGIPILT